jgi:hypothetical protein
VAFEYRYANGHYGHLPALAAELVRVKMSEHLQQIVVFIV